MNSFQYDGVRLYYLDAGPASAPPVLLLHGFASSAAVNWVAPGWVDTLTAAGFRVLAPDQRGHGASTKLYDPGAYTPAAMVDDAVALLDHLELPQAVFFGYSMGARVAAFAAVHRPERVSALILGGLGIGLVKGVGNWDPIAQALLALSIDDVTDPTGRMFRAFADRTGSDRRALAACIATSRQELTPNQVALIRQPTLIGVGTRDEIAGSADALAALMPDARAFSIAHRDHMLAVGDRTFKAEVLRFLQASDRK